MQTPSVEAPDRKRTRGRERRADELKNQRAQAAVDERKSVGALADAIAATEYDREAVARALNLRVQSAEHLRDAVADALASTHALLRPEQRKKLAYLLRSGQITI